MAEDLTQEVFGRALTALRDFRGESSARTWLLKIARNRCIDHLRARQREPWGGVGDEAEPDQHPDSAPLPVDLIARRGQLSLALEQLAEGERALVILRFRHGLDYRELAAAFGLREGAVRMRISRALARMRRALVEPPPPMPQAAPAPAPAPPALESPMEAVLWTFVITASGGQQRRLELDKPEVNVGRARGNDIILPAGNVSKRHARFVLKDGKVIIVDLRSSNGTFVNGRKITTPLVIKETDRIHIGDFILHVEPGERVDPALVAPRRAAQPPAGPAVRDTLEQPPGPRRPPPPPLPTRRTTPSPMQQAPSRRPPPPGAPAAPRRTVRQPPPPRRAPDPFTPAPAPTPPPAIDHPLPAALALLDPGVSASLRERLLSMVARMV
jgi:RNA polymerase sigma factor (sigma-70 family)